LAAGIQSDLTVPDPAPVRFGSPSGENGDRVHDAGHAWDLICDRLSRADLQARSHYTIEIDNMIHRLHADRIWLQEGAPIELQHYIRSDLRVTRAAAKAAFLIGVV
jgi:hypothetical protein